ncbi:hypothetical protein JCM3775_000932 [Rhodotorula graminis]|uniref:F-box domain-containing protein n=1 Tax=Rhodotorula graminis (strain WP1) TaxID=578459 RepID=A0A0P9ENS7_RHOGW|nr:uncharacterized protein RHOBADRAFT_54962 [Rhodotorula graminis WP1]KPV73780.1 hypothetical protein RHOBADRAFT_54962 [Rhodotorula graminis WP1]
MLIWKNPSFYDLSGPRRLHRPELEQQALRRVMVRLPPNPLLPSPRLPQELINIILEHLEDIDDNVSDASHDPHDVLEAESEQRELGKAIFYVCKAWRVAGRRIAYFRVTFHWEDDDEVIEWLLKNPSLAKEIRKLYFGPPDRLIARRLPTHRQAAVKFVELVEKCSTRLDTLACSVPVEAPALWRRIAISAAAEGLRDLLIITAVSREDGLLSLISVLSKFPGLKKLGIQLEVWPKWTPSSGGIKSASVVTRLPVKDLTLRLNQFSGTSPVPLMGQMLAPFFIPGEVRDLNLELSEFEAANLTWIGAFDKVECVVLTSDSADEALGPRLAHFVDAASSLPAVKQVFIDPDPDEDVENGTELVPSPVSLDRLFKSMPPLIVWYSVGGGVFFPEEKDDDLPIIAFEVAPEPSVLLDLNLKLKQDKEPSPAALYRRTQADGAKTWSVLEITKSDLDGDASDCEMADSTDAD